MSASLLLILTEFPPSFGGMQTHAVELCRFLHSRGFRIEVATYRGIQGPAPAPSFPFTVHRCLSRISYQANLRRLSALAAGAGAQLIYSSTVYFGDLAQRTGLPVICRSAGNDVMRPWIAWPFKTGSALLDLPFFENHIYHRLKRWTWPEKCENLLWRQRIAVMRQSAQSMSRIFANSHFTQRLLSSQRIAVDRIALLPGGVDAESFASCVESRIELRRRLGLDVDGYYLLTACRLVPKKGLDTLLQALAVLRRRDARVRLLIAGEGGDRKLCLQWIQELGLGEAATLLGYLPQHRLKDYFHAADVFVLSSREIVNPRNGVRDAETMGRVLCEANACGIPVIASRSGGIPSIISDGFNGLLIEENSPSSLAAKVSTLKDDPSLAANLVRGGLERAKNHFDWRILFDAHEQAIRRLIQGRESVRAHAGKLDV